MSKISTLLLAVLISISTAFAVDITGGTKLYMTPNAEWKTDNARFAAYFYDAVGGTAWVSMTVANETGPVYQAVAPAGTWSNVIFCRMNPTTIENNWSNKWNQTADLEYDGALNYYVLNAGSWDGVGVWAVYTDPVTDPEVYINAPSSVYVDETIALSATSINVANPVYTYWVKAPGTPDFVEVRTIPYVPAAGVGIYEFEVEVTEATNPTAVLAIDAASVIVKEVPEPITITVNAKNTDWSEIAIWNWSDGVDGNFVIPTEGDAGIYSYTFERRETVGVIFVESDGTAWPEDEDYNTRLGKQTVNVEGIAEDACFIIGAQAYPDGDNYAKRTVVAVDCADINAISVELNAPERVYTDETIALSATSLNVATPVYAYWVKAPGADDFVEVITTPYVPTAGPGIYEFEVDLSDATNPTVVLATAAASVDVKVVPEPITVTVDISETDWTQVAIWYWNYGNFGAFAVPEEVSEGVYSYTFTRIDELGVIFVESDGLTWPEDEDYDTRLGKQTVNVEGITADACYVIGEQEFPEDNDYAKRTVSECVAAAVAAQGSSLDVISNEKKIEVSFIGSANVEVYTVGGILLTSQVAENQFSYPVSEGVYIVRVNDEVQKILVK